MSTKRIHLIACGVLRVDMEAVSKELGIEFETTWLEGGLHSTPVELRRRLQAAIDAVEHADLIAVGYGICGRGTVDLHARDIPLAIPRVHDCISLFLGSDEAYSREFAGCPGTYYISAGWYEEKIQPKQGADHVESDPKARKDNPSYQYLVDKYGSENAEEITEFLSSWQRNYQRSVFIDTGNKKKANYEQYAKDMAEEFGWEYKKLDGDLSLLKALLNPTDPETILTVPAGYVTAFDPLSRKLTAHPEAGEQSADGADLENTGSNTSSDKAPTRRERLGLGIDAGGTYTDVAVFNFSDRSVLETAKALTTKWDYTVGINEALDSLTGDWYDRIDIVAVSTTLATNAIVEGTGQQTGLILMPPGGVGEDEFAVPTVVVPGKMNISGGENEPVNLERVRQAGREMRDKLGVKAFAVSGYAGSVNPAHELAVKQALVDETGLDVCCGHELSDLLDFRIRAHTAVLNAGIIPLLERFLREAGASLTDRGIKAPLMVVKGDGTLMKESRARMHPVETILSGPAASIAGARYLTRGTDATIVDVGGTTSDIGRLREGKVDVCPRGAVVGKWRTHVRAVDMHTLGLGGDSEVVFDKQEILVGPRRVAPVCWLASKRDCRKAFDHLQRNLDYYSENTRLMQLFTATGREPLFPLTDQEERILELLALEPMSAVQLVEALQVGHPALLRFERLEQEYLVQRCGLTPTDLLHTTGTVSLWDRSASETYLNLVSGAAGRKPEDLREEVFSLISEKLVFELVKRQLPLEYMGEDLEDSATGKALFDTLLKGGNPYFDLSAVLKQPVIGLGAAATFFLQEPAKRLSAELIIPPHAGVANAVGAVTSLVQVRKKGSISPSPDGMYLLSGVTGSHQYKNFDEAHRNLVAMLEGEVKVLAREAGTGDQQVDINYEDRMSMAADGTKIFIQRNVTAGITGIPVA